MPKYRVMEKSFINDCLVDPGEIVEYDGEVSSNLELIPDESPAEPSAEPDGPPKKK